MSFELTREREQQLESLLDQYPTERAVCIPLLHLCQEQEGYLSERVIEFVATKLGISTAAVQGVATFYTSLHHQKVGKHVIWVCRTLSCELRGAAQVQNEIEKCIGCKPGQTSEDGMFTLKKAECLAGCGYAPVVQIDERYFENLKPRQVRELVERVRNGDEPTCLSHTAEGALVEEKP